MASTSHLGIVLLEQSQAQKEITINEALSRIDALLNSGVIDRDLATPPTTPAAGDVYIVATGPTGDWAGKAGQIAYFDQYWRFVVPAEGLTLWVRDEDVQLVYNGTAWQVLAGGNPDFAQVVQGRLTLTTGVPVTSSDVTAATTLYFMPYQGNHLALYNGTAWQLLTFSEISLAVPSTTNTNYDVWAYNNSGTAALEATAWTNDTTRATALAWQNGVYVKSGATTRRYLGTIRTTGTSGQCEDSKAKRFVWNYYHRALRLLIATESTANWNYSTATWRQANGNTANQVAFVRGLNEDAVIASTTSVSNNSTATYRVISTGIGEDSAGTVSMRYGQQAVNNVGAVNIYGNYDAMPSAGYHYLAWLERGAGTDVQTWYGGGSFGIFGQVRG